MTETSDSGNYSQYSSENASETNKQSSINNLLSDDSEEDEDYDSEKNDQTSVYTWVNILFLLPKMYQLVCKFRKSYTELHEKS